MVLVTFGIVSAAFGFGLFLKIVLRTRMKRPTSIDPGSFVIGFTLALLMVSIHSQNVYASMAMAILLLFLGIKQHVDAD